MNPFVLAVVADAFRSGLQLDGALAQEGVEVRLAPRMGPLPAGELIQALKDADAVVASTDPYTDEVLSACPRLQAVVRWGTGYDSVDLAACTRHGVLACNTPGLNIDAVADHALLLMLGAARNIARQVTLVRSGDWAEVRGTELWGSHVGLVGFGAIGKAVARRLQGFNCTVLAYDPSLTPEVAAELGVESVSLDHLLSNCRFVSLHAAVTPESRGLIGEAELRKMRDAFLINTARGALIDEAALLRALTEGWIAGAALDTFTSEPLAPGHPFRHLPNCLTTPHSAFNTEEAVSATNREVYKVVKAVARGRRPPHLLNPEVLRTTQLRVGPLLED